MANFFSFHENRGLEINPLKPHVYVCTSYINTHIPTSMSSCNYFGPVLINTTHSPNQQPPARLPQPLPVVILLQEILENLGEAAVTITGVVPRNDSHSSVGQAEVSGQHVPRGSQRFHCLEHISIVVI